MTSYQISRESPHEPQRTGDRTGGEHRCHCQPVRVAPGCGGSSSPRIFGESGGTDYEPYEEDDEFVLTIEPPGFDRDETSPAWDDGVLDVSAERVDEDGIAASYRNGVLEVTLPLADEAAATGTPVPIEG